jgi:hypothetical protein
LLPAAVIAAFAHTFLSAFPKLLAGAAAWGDGLLPGKNHMQNKPYFLTWKY